MARQIKWIFWTVLIITGLSWSQAPTLQSIYPEANDVLLGTTPFMVYSTDAGTMTDVDSVKYRIETTGGGSIVTPQHMTKVQDNNSGLWMATFNTKGGSTPDDNYNLIFTAYEDGGDSTAKTVAVTVQNSSGTSGGPVFDSLSLSTGQVITATYVLSFKVEPTSGNSLVASDIDISIDGGSYADVDSTPVLSSGGYGKDTINTLGLTDGVHTIRLRAKDDGGSAVWGYSDLIIFNVNNSGNLAQVVLTAPADTAVKSGNVTVSFTVTPPTNGSVDSLQITVGGVNWVKTQSNTSHTFNSGNFPNGSHIIRVRAFSDNNTIGYSNPISLMFDNDPDVTLTSPTAGATVSGNVTIEFRSTSTSGLSHTDIVLVDGAESDTADTDTTHTWATQALKDGEHMLQIKCIDSKGHIGLSMPIVVQVANKPSVALNSPKADSMVSGTLVVGFTTSVISPATIDKTEISVDGGPFRNTSTGTTDTLDTRPLSEGSHTLQVKVTDSDGRSDVSGILKFVLKNTPSVSVSNPGGGDTLSGVITVNFTATPVSPATIAKTEISLDGSGYGGTTTGSSHTLNTLGLADGSHTISIKVTDSEGKSAISPGLMVVTKNTPIVILGKPVADATITGPMSVEFSITPASDDDSVKSVQLAIDGGEWKDTDSDSSSSFDTRILTEGKHQIQIKAVNKNNKSGYSRIVEFTVRNMPSVSILAPAVDAILQGEKNIKFKSQPIAPDSIVKTEISIGGGNWQEVWKDGDKKSDSTYQLKTSDFKDGNLRVQFKTTDGSGKTGMSHIREFVIDNSGPKVSLPKLNYADTNAVDIKTTSVTVTALSFDMIAGMAGDSAVAFIYHKVDTNIDDSKSPPDTTVDTAEVIVEMYDDGPSGKHGDKVKGDNIYSNLVVIDVNASGAHKFQIKARDAVGNTTTIDSIVVLDNAPPVVKYTLTPEPKNGSDAIHGEVYVNKILLKGQATDIGSGLRRLSITVRNKEGEHINNSPMDVVSENGKFSRIINLVEGQNIITLIGEDRAGYIDSVQGRVAYIRPKVTKVVKPKGEKVSSPNGSAVNIPKDALFTAKEITMRVVDEKDEPKPLESNIQLLGNPHEFGPDGTIFRKPVTITLAYTDLDLDPDQDLTPDIKPEDLAIYFWDGSSWLIAGNPSLDKKKRTVSVSVNHFTMYDIGVDTSSNKVPDEFTAYWTHNPVKREDGSTMVIQIPKKGKLSVSIFDMAGDLVRKLISERGENPGQVSEMWAGDNTMDHFAGAGLYIYLLRYESDDGSIKKLIRKPVGLLKD